MIKNETKMKGMGRIEVLKDDYTEYCILRKNIKEAIEKEVEHYPIVHRAFSKFASKKLDISLSEAEYMKIDPLIKIMDKVMNYGND